MSWLNRWRHNYVFGTDYRVFVDKFCIHQSNHQWTSLGVARLPLYLKSSQRLNCLFDHVWVSRLWCVFELAVYLKVRKNPRIVFTSISKGVVEVYAVVVSNILCLVHHVLQEMVQSIGSQSFYEFNLYFTWASMVCFSGVLFILAHRHYKANLALRETIATYDIRNAESQQEHDRDMLLRFVDELFRGDAKKQKKKKKPAAKPASVEERRSTELERFRNSIDLQGNEARPGLDMFNQTIRERVPAQLPVRGLKSWMILSYKPAVLFFCVESALLTFDIWAYRSSLESDPARQMLFPTWKKSFRSIAAFSWGVLKKKIIKNIFGYATRSKFVQNSNFSSTGHLFVSGFFYGRFIRS